MRWSIVILLLSALAAAQQQAVSPASDASLRHVSAVVVPVGTQIPLRLAQGISTKSAKVGDAVYAETVFPVTQNDRIVIPAGTYVQGRISQIKRPGRVKGRAEFLMHFTTLIFKSGYTVMLPGAVENVPGAEQQRVKGEEGTIQQEGTKGRDVATVAKTTATGAGIGAVAGQSAKGAAIGGAAGAAVGLGWAMLTRGPDVNLPVGTSVQMVLQRELELDGNRIR